MRGRVAELDGAARGEERGEQDRQQAPHRRNIAQARARVEAQVLLSPLVLPPLVLP